MRVWLLAAVLGAPGACHGQAGYAASFLGQVPLAGPEAGFIDYEDPGMKDLDNEISIAFWVQLNEMDSTSRTIFTWSHKGNGNYIQFLTSGMFVGATYLQFPMQYNIQEWAHVALSWGGDGTATTYLNGEIFHQGAVALEDLRFDYATFYMSGNLYSYVDEMIVAAHWMSAQVHIDELAIWNRPITQAETLAVAQNGLALPNADPTLMVYYTFDEVCLNGTAAALRHPSCPEAADKVAINHGVAGPKYNLRLGSLSDIYGHGTRWAPVSGTLEGGALSGPTGAIALSPSGAQIQNDRQAPRVTQLKPEEAATITILNTSAAQTEWRVSSLPQDISVAVSGTSLTTEGQTFALGAGSTTTLQLTASAAFAEPAALALVDPVSGAQAQVHVWPSEAPSVRDKSLLVQEDTAARIRLLEYAAHGLGDRFAAKITTFPAKGTLFQVERDATGQPSRGLPLTQGDPMVTDKQGMIEFLPGKGETGVEYASIGFAAVSLVSGLESPVGTASITVSWVNDLVQSQEAAFEMDEDAGKILIELKTVDEEDAARTTVITKLPSKGKLYKTSDGTLQGTLTEITESYEIFRIGTIKSQYVDDVVSASSFWGNPPSTGYHALNLIGGPSCVEFGNCEDSRPVHPIKRHLLDEPPVGDLVNLNRNYAYPDRDRVEVWSKVEGAKGPRGNRTFSVRVLDMFRETVDGSAYELCALTGASFPHDCVPIDDSERDEWLWFDDVPLEAIHRDQQGVWCPLVRAWDKGVTYYGGWKAAAYGPEFNFTHSQDALYSSESASTEGRPYTEFIEIKFKTPVFPVELEIGSSRGYGSVVNIRALAPDGRWNIVFTDAARRERYDRGAAERLYDRETPALCRTAFKTDTFRLELDTSEETGISDWNYIDYVLLFGATDIQPAVLEYPETHVVYEPAKDENGDDAFSFTSYDCGGARSRKGNEAQVSISIAAHRDLPEIQVLSRGGSARLGPGKTRTIMLEVKSRDFDAVGARIIGLPSKGKLFDMTVESSNSTELAVLSELVLQPLSRRTWVAQVGWSTQVDGICVEVGETNVTVTVQAYDIAQTSTGPVSLIDEAVDLSFDLTLVCTEADIVVDISTLAVSGGMMVFGFVCILFLTWKLRNSTLSALELVFSPIVVTIFSMMAEVADLVSDVAACINIVQDAGKASFHGPYIGLTIVAAVVSVWGVRHRIKYFRFLFRNLSDSSVHQSRVERGKATSEQIIAVVKGELDMCLATIGSIQTTAVLLVAEDIPMVTMNMFLIIKDRTFMENDAFLASFFISFAMMVVKITITSRLRRLRIERRHFSKVLALVEQDPHLSNLETLTPLLLSGKQNHSMRHRIAPQPALS